MVVSEWWSPEFKKESRWSRFSDSIRAKLFGEIANRLPHHWYHHSAPTFLLDLNESMGRPPPATNSSCRAGPIVGGSLTQTVRSLEQSSRQNNTRSLTRCSYSGLPRLRNQIIISSQRTSLGNKKSAQDHLSTSFSSSKEVWIRSTTIELGN